MREDRMYINVDALEIMVQVRRQEMMEQSRINSVPKRHKGSLWTRRALVRLGGFLVLAGMTIERIGLDREVYHLSTTGSH
jgi:hypothetical protein